VNQGSKFIVNIPKVREEALKDDISIQLDAQKTSPH
jgi:hypothetical protein